MQRAPRYCAWLLLAMVPAAAGASDRRPPAPEPAALPSPAAAFEPNRGQCDPAVRFLGRAGRVTAFLTAEGAVFPVPEPSAPFDRRTSDPPPRRPVRMEWVGAAPAEDRAAEPLGGRSHYLLGDRRVADVPRHGAVLRRAAWKGVDLRWDAAPEGLRYSFRVAPGADPGGVAFRLRGTVRAAVAADGALVADTAGGAFLRHGAPTAWSEDGSARIPVRVRFAIREDGAVGFSVGPRRADLPLVIDPVVEYGTYLGGTGNETLFAAALAPGGDVLLAGLTASSAFPIKNSVDAAYSGTNEAFVTRLDASGTSLDFSTFLGGSSDEAAYCVAVDGNGDVIVGGDTASTNFPLANAVQPAKSGTRDGFVSRIAAGGSTLLTSTYLGGTGNERVHALLQGPSGDYFLCGYTTSANFPLAGAFRSTYVGQEGFLMRATVTGSVVWSTYVGGNGTDAAYAMAVGPAGDLHVAGYTTSSDITTASAWDRTYGGSNDGFVSRVDAGGTLLWTTYVGGAGSDQAFGIAVDALDTSVVVGTTASSDFPTLNAIQPLRASTGTTADAFVTYIQGSGTGISVSTYLGGTLADYANDVTLDGNGTAFVTGYTLSTNFPLAAPTQSFLAGSNDAWVAVLAAGGTSLPFATYLGGAAQDEGHGIAASAAGRKVRVAGSTASTDFPVAGAYQAGRSGGYDAFAVRIDLPVLPPENPTATGNSAYTVQLGWQDRSWNETGFALERRILPSGSFEPAGTVAAQATSWIDTGLEPGTTYEYRVRATNPEGDSVWSDTVQATTSVVGSTPPGDTTATALSPTSIRVTWSDRSDDETKFYVYRRTAGGAEAPLAVQVAADTTQWTDTGRVPATAYSYFVRAVGPSGSTAASPEAGATTHGTLGVVLGKGTVKDGAKFGTDGGKITGTISFLDASPDGTWDPTTEGFLLVVRGPGALFGVSAPGYDPNWKVKGTKATWKSPPESPSKAKVTVDLATGVFSVTISRTEFPAAPVLPLSVRVESGNDAGLVSGSDWIPLPKGGFKR